MALVGSLKDFNIADIFQLVAQQGKSGILHVKSGRFIMRVYFFNGLVVRSEVFENGRPVDVLLMMLLRSGVITPNDFQHILDQRARSMKRTEDILLDENFIGPEDLVHFIKLKNNELLYKLMGWKEGDFEFEPSEISINSAYDTPQAADGVLMDAFRVVDEWPSVNNVIYAVNMTFEIDHTGEDFERVAERNEFGEPERRIYSLILENNKYDVQKLIDLSRLGEFETCKALYNLVRTNILIPKRPHKPVPFNALKGGSLDTRRVIIPSVVVLNVILGIIAVFTVLLLVAGIFSRIRTISDESPMASVRISIYKRLISNITRERIANSMKVYRFSTGNDPDRLEQLVQSGLLSERDLSYPFILRYRLKIENDSRKILNPLY